MTLHIDWEGVEAIGKGLVTKLLLPLSPLIIEHIVQRGDCIALLPLSEEIDICGRWIYTMQLCLCAQDVL